MSAREIHEGRRLAEGEAVVWRGAPSFRRLAVEALHVRGVAAYLALLALLDAYQAWTKAIPLGKAVHDSVPLAVIAAVVLGNVVGLAWLMERTIRYTLTDRRLIVEYGIAIPAVLSLPFARIKRVSLSVTAHGFGNIALQLDADDHMPFLKLWPLARPWHVTHPQPMLRAVPQAAVVAGLASRAISAVEIDRMRDSAPAFVTATAA